MLITIHQPEHLPWPGFFHKMSLADKYILLDCVQFSTNYWQNRNRIVDRNGSEVFLTVPVLTKGHTQSAIRDIKINNSEKWQKKYWGRLHNAYCKHPYWNYYKDELESIIVKPYIFLLDINIALITFFRKVLSIETPLQLASELYPNGSKTDLLVDICTQCGANTYLSGPSGRDYMNMDMWKKAEINVIFHEFKPPQYVAPYYLPALSTLDVLMNCGDNSSKVIGITKQ